MNSKKVYNKNLIVIALMFLFVGLYYLPIWNDKGNFVGGHYKYLTGGVYFILLWVVLTCILLFCVMYDCKWGIYFFLCMMALVLLFADISYSPIDEGAHLDYVNHIIKHHKLPTMFDKIDVELLEKANSSTNLVEIENYEAVQMPLYYIICALLTFSVSNLTIRFFMLRLFGFFCMVAIILVTRKTLILLKDNKMIQLGKTEEMIFFLFVLNPGIIVRFTRISNECLAVLLATLIISLCIKMLLEGYSVRLGIIVLFLSVALFYTKSTGAFCVGALLIILIYFKKWKIFFLDFMIYVLGAIPWFLYCKKLYGSLTGMNVHLNIVLPIINPDMKPVDWLSNAVSIFSAGYFSPAEMTKTIIFEQMNTFFGIFLLIILIVAVIKSFQYGVQFIFHKLNFTYEIPEKKKILVCFSAALIFVEIIMLIISSISTYANTLIGRYMYFTIIPMIILICIALEYIKCNNVVLMTVCTFFSLCTILTITTYTNTIGVNRGYWSVTEKCDINNLIENDMQFCLDYCGGEKELYLIGSLGKEIDGG